MNKSFERIKVVGEMMQKVMNNVANIQNHIVTNHRQFEFDK